MWLVQLAQVLIDEVEIEERLVGVDQPGADRAGNAVADGAAIDR